MRRPLAPMNQPATWQRNAAEWRLMRGQRELARIYLLPPDCAADFPHGTTCEIFLTDDYGERHFHDYGSTATKAKAIAFRGALANQAA